MNYIGPHYDPIISRDDPARLAAGSSFKLLHLRDSTEPLNCFYHRPLELRSNWKFISSLGGLSRGGRFSLWPGQDHHEVHVIPELTWGKSDITVYGHENETRKRRDIHAVGARGKVLDDITAPSTSDG